MSLREGLEKVIGPSKEDLDYTEWRKKQPPVTMEKANAQLRASRAFREKHNREHGNLNHTRNHQRGN
jgi:hypothetical protein